VVDHRALSSRLDAALDKVDAKPFRIASCTNSREVQDSIVGVANPNAGTPQFRSAYALLAELDVVESVFRPHFFRTVERLGMPELNRAQGLLGAVQELSELRDGEVSRGVPHDCWNSCPDWRANPLFGTQSNAGSIQRHGTEEHAR